MIYEVIIDFVLIMVLISIQYTLNKILLSIKKIERKINDNLINSDIGENNERRNIIK